MGVWRKLSRGSYRAPTCACPSRGPVVYNNFINTFCLDSPERVAAYRLTVPSKTKLASCRKPSRLRARDAECWGWILKAGTPPPQMHTLHQAMSPQVLSLCYHPRPQLSLPAPAFLQPGLYLLSSPSLPPPIIPGHINHLPIENSVVTPLKRPFHIHLPTQHQKQILLPPGKWPSQH